jgi:hypothetical protein
MAKPIVLLPKPDDATQELWYGVAAASDTIGDLIEHIPCSGVGGQETRSELHEAQVLLGRAATLLERTAERYRKWQGIEEVTHG